MEQFLAFLPNLGHGALATLGLTLGAGGWCAWTRESALQSVTSRPGQVSTFDRQRNINRATA